MTRTRCIGTQGHGDRRPRTRYGTCAAVAVLLALALAGPGGSPAFTLGKDDLEPVDVPVPRCVTDLQVRSFTVEPSTTLLENYGQSVTLRWDVRVPCGCTDLQLSLSGLYLGYPKSVGRQGTQSVQPLSNVSYVLHAGLPTGLQYEMARPMVTVGGRPTVTIKIFVFAPGKLV